MTHPYPIVNEHPLTHAPKRRALGFRRASRDINELPRPLAHQVLVYRVNGDYLLDPDRLKVDHEEVVSASHVSVVDMAHDVQVMVQLDVPSSEAADFVLQVTFLCTVTDPVTVVRLGLNDAATTLTSYLKSHRRIFELGLGHKISEITEVRLDVNAQVTAYTRIEPPHAPGMLIKMASIEVLTPNELAEFHKARRGRRNEYELAAEDQQFEHRLETDRQRSGHHLDLEKVKHTQSMACRQQRHDQLMGADDLRYKQILDAERLEFQRRQLDQLTSMVGDDPGKAVLLAYTAGQKDADGLVAELRNEQNRAQAIADARWQSERADQMQQRQWNREDALSREEDKRRRLEIKMEILRDLVKEGHLGMTNVDGLIGAVQAELIGRPESTITGPDMEPDAIESKRNDNTSKQAGSSLVRDPIDEMAELDLREEHDG